VALQFPDALLPHSIQVSTWLSAQTPSVQYFVLADTTFGSCCVDEIAAEHAVADALVHFGRSCMSPNRRLPVLYIFPKKDNLVTSDFVKNMLNTFEKDDVITLRCEVFYHHCMSKISHHSLAFKIGSNYYILGIDSIQSALTDAGFVNVRYKSLETERSGNPNASVKARSTASCSSTPESKCCGGSCQSAYQNETSEDDKESTLNKIEDLKEACESIEKSPETIPNYIVFIGQESLTLTHLILSHRSTEIYLYNPTSSNPELSLQSGSVNRLLARRYYLVQRAKDADRIGIVVGTLGVGKCSPNLK
jgi:diphthamide biosynthesis protein 2